MRLLEAGGKITLRFVHRNHLGVSADLSTPTLKVYGPKGTLVISAQTTNVTKVSTGTYDAIIDTSVAAFTTEGNGTYRALLYGTYAGDTSIADHQLFEIGSISSITRYITVSEALDYLRLTESDINTNFLRDLIDTATNVIHAYTGRKFYRQTETDEHSYAEACYNLFTRYYPVISITTIKIDDDPLTSDSYNVDLRFGRIRLDEAVTGEIKLTYIHGVTTVPENVRTASLMLTAFFANRRLREGLNNEHILSYGYSLTLAPENIPAEIKGLLDSERIVRVY